MYKERESLLLIAIYLFFTSVLAFNYEKCNLMDCPKGPIRFYEDLYCKPIYGSDECCPIEYDCSHALNVKLLEHCYRNNATYEINEKINEIDLRYGEESCVCKRDRSSKSTELDCKIKCAGGGPPPRRTYYKVLTNDPCENKIVPYSKPRITCEVNDETFMEGDSFSPVNEPLKDCMCLPGYSGVNNETFCISHKNFCKTEFRFRRMLVNKHAPTYNSEFRPQRSCPLYTKRYKFGNKVQLAKEKVNSNAGNCIFGELSLPIKAFLKRYNNETNEYSCTKCICRIPPVLTCQSLPKSDCEIDFEIYKEKRKNNKKFYERLETCTLIETDIE